MGTLTEFTTHLREMLPDLEKAVSLLERGAGTGFPGSLQSSPIPGQKQLTASASPSTFGGVTLPGLGAGVRTAGAETDPEKAAAWFLGRGCTRAEVPSGVLTAGGRGTITGWQCPDRFYPDEDQFLVSGISSGGRRDAVSNVGPGLQYASTFGRTSEGGDIYWTLNRPRPGGPAPLQTDPNLATVEGQVATIEAVDRLATSIDRLARGDGGAATRAGGGF